LDVEPTKCRFRGEDMDLCDALMMLTKEELEEVEVKLTDGSIARLPLVCLPGMGPTKGLFRGQEVDLLDARKGRTKLTKDDLPEIEVLLGDGSRIRPFRFCEVDPVIRSSKDGILSF
jgi:hypothetical protein